MKRKILSIVGAAVILLMALVVSSFIVKSKEEPPRDKSKHSVLYVKTAVAEDSEIISDAKYRGRVSSYENVSLTPEVSGKILPGAVRLKEGESFSKGDLLVKIYDETAKASLQSLRSSYLQLISVSLPDIKVDFPAEFEKWNDFFNAIDINKELPGLPEVSSEKERVFMASKNILTQYYTISQQEIIYKKYALYAPFDGSYKQVNAEVGSVASMNMTIASLIRTDEMEAVIPVLPEDLEWIHEGMIVELEKNNGNSVKGKVNRIASFIDAGSRMVNVYVTVSNRGENSLLEGEYVEAMFSSGNHITGMQVPREAVLDENKVYTVKDGKLATRKVNILARFDDSFVISGYEDGDVVVVESLVDVNVGDLAASLSDQQAMTKPIVEKPAEVEQEKEMSKKEARKVEMQKRKTEKNG